MGGDYTSWGRAIKANAPIFPEFGSTST